MRCRSGETTGLGRATYTPKALRKAPRLFRTARARAFVCVGILNKYDTRVIRWQSEEARSTPFAPHQSHAVRLNPPNARLAISQLCLSHSIVARIRSRKLLLARPLVNFRTPN